MKVCIVSFNAFHNTFHLQSPKLHTETIMEKGNARPFPLLILLLQNLMKN